MSELDKKMNEYHLMIEDGSTYPNGMIKKW